MNKRPISITIIGFLFILTGATVVILQLGAFVPQQPVPRETYLILLINLIAGVSGVYLLRARNWARWAALAWITFHVILSAFHSRFEVTVHALLCAALAYFLFRPDAAQYFREQVTRPAKQ
jgi:hypothetical protein